MQRSRAYARESQIRETGKAAVFPDRKAPQVAEYSIRKTYGRLLEMFEKAFTRKNPLFTLPMYYPLAWYKGSDKSIDPLEQDRQKQVVGLIRTNFLKAIREFGCLRSSCLATGYYRNCWPFSKSTARPTPRRSVLSAGRPIMPKSLATQRKRQLDFWAEDDDESEDEDIVPQEMLDDVEPLDREEYDVSAMMSETFLDLDQIVHFLPRLGNSSPSTMTSSRSSSVCSSQRSSPAKRCSSSPSLPIPPAI